MNLVPRRPDVTWTLVAALMALAALGPAVAQVPDENVPAKAAPPAPTLPKARDLLTEGDYEAAIEAFETLAKEPRLMIPATLGLAEAQMRIGNYQQAMALLEPLDAKNSARRSHLLAQLYGITGRYDDAEREAKEALKLDENHAGARLLLGQMSEMRGRTDDAVEIYRWFDQQIVQRPNLPRDPAWVTHTGLGFLRYSVLTDTSVPQRTQHVLNEMLQVAYTRIDRAYWPARVAAADLLREKYNNDDEDGSVSDYFAALKINPRLPEAHVGLGEVALTGWGFEETEHRAELALEINPNFAPAHHLMSRKYLLERRYRQAISSAQDALKINPRDLIALSLAAAGYACQFDQQGVEKFRAQVAAINPRSALYHRTLGDALSGIRQYAASEQEYLKAIEYDRSDANARTELGMMYMQWGDEAKARDALDAAWNLDPYNERTKFTLELLDQLHKFARHETDHFIVKYDEEKDPGLGGFVADYLESMHADVTDDFSTKLHEKTIIELFPTHKAFAVRITGKPWIYTVGASTGRVIALTAPRDSTHTMGQYNLARVLKHEFTHTVTLAATHNRIPHWLTEGLAVYQEDSPRSYEWSELLVESLRRNALFTLESIDWGFIRPKRSGDRQMAYAQSEWMVEFIVERFGYDSIQKMLNRYRDGATQPQVLRELFQWELDDFDREFARWAREAAATWGCRFDLTPPEDVVELRDQARQAGVTARTIARLARAEYDVGEYDRAEDAARKALELDPDERVALEIMVKLHAILVSGETGEDKRKREDEALPCIEALLKLDPDHRDALKLRGLITLRREEYSTAKEVLERLQRSCPLEPASWQGLGGIFLHEGDDDRALPQLVELSRMTQTDSDVPRKVGDIYRRKENLGEAAFWYGQALFINPFEARLHEALAATLMEAHRYPAAVKEYEMLTRLDPTKASYFESAALAALKAGDREAARRFAERATAINPATTVGKMFESAPTP